MIFTECPYCEEPQCFGWESGDCSGFFPSKCSKCGKVMWVEATSIGGVTRGHEDFIVECVRSGDEAEVDVAAKKAKVLNLIEKEDQDEL